MKEVTKVKKSILILAILCLLVAPVSLVMTSDTTEANYPMIQVNRVNIVTTGSLVIRPGDTFCMCPEVNNYGDVGVTNVLMIFGYEISDQGNDSPQEIEEALEKLGLNPNDFLPLSQGVVKSDVPFEILENRVAVIPDLEPGRRSLPLHFLLMADEDAEPRKYDVPLAVFYEYENEGYVQQGSTQERKVVELVPRSGNTFVDVVQVDAVHTDSNKNIIEPGDTFTLSLKLKCQGTSTAENIRIYLAYDLELDNESGVIPEVIGNLLKDALEEALGGISLDEIIGGASGLVAGTETPSDLVEMPFVPVEDFIQYVDVLRPGGEKTIEFILQASSTAEPRSYAVPISILYYDTATGEELVTNDVVGIKLAGEPRFEIAGKNTDPSPLHEGDDYTLEVQIQNIGTAEAKSVRAHLDNGTSFLGSMIPGDVGIAMFELEADDQDSHILTVEYLNEEGEWIPTVKDIQLNIRPKEQLNIYYYVVPIAIGVLIGIIVIFWRRRGRRTEAWDE